MTQDERLMILQMVADRKITASEAAELLRAIDGREVGPAESQAPYEFPGAPGETAVPPLPEVPPVPPVPPAPPIAERAARLGNGLGAFIEDLVERVSSAFGEAIGPRWEFPEEKTGEFTGTEVPLRIHTGNGRVEVRAWDQPGWKALITVKARGSSEAEARERAQNAYTLRTEHGFDLEARRTDWGDVAVHVTLMVPQDKRYRLETRTGNGAVELDRLDLTEGRATTGNGRLVCRGGRSDSLFMKSGNGSLDIFTDSANLEAESGNGSIAVGLTGTRSQQVRVSTGNGSARISTGGLMPETGLRIEAHTGMGSVSVSVPNLVYDRDSRSVGHKHVVARTANFDQAATRIQIYARTGMGSVTID